MNKNIHVKSTAKVDDFMRKLESLVTDFTNDLTRETDRPTDFEIPSVLDLVLFVDGLDCNDCDDGLQEWYLELELIGMITVS